MTANHVARVEWKCPRCSATPDGGCKGTKKTIEPIHRNRDCMGFVCECSGDTVSTHGESANDPCPSATCHHCGWGGTFPPLPFKLTGWAKKARDAGWRPPEGWSP